MKLLFLDFDGVVNTDEWRAEATRRKLPPSQHLFRPMVKRVNTIVEQTGARVIASTNWRIGYTKNALEEMLRSAGGTFPLYSTTPLLPSPRQADLFTTAPIEPTRLLIPEPTRGHEILACMEGIGEEVEAFAILDDLDPSEFDFFGRQNLIYVNGHIGLTEIGAFRAIKLLTSKGHGFTPPPDVRVDWSEGMRPGVVGGESQCLHVPPLHEPGCALLPCIKQKRCACRKCHFYNTPQQHHNWVVVRSES